MHAFRTLPLRIQFALFAFSASLLRHDLNLLSSIQGNANANALCTLDPILCFGFTQQILAFLTIQYNTFHGICNRPVYLCKVLVQVNVCIRNATHAKLRHFQNEKVDPVVEVCRSSTLKMVTFKSRKLVISTIYANPFALSSTNNTETARLCACTAGNTIFYLILMHCKARCVRGHQRPEPASAQRPRDQIPENAFRVYRGYCISLCAGTNKSKHHEEHRLLHRPTHVCQACVHHYLYNQR